MKTPRRRAPSLAPARRSIVKLYRHLRTELALLRRAAASDDDEAPEGFQEIAQKLTERIEVVERDVFSLQERARLLHEDIDSRAQAETNRHLYILSLLTAFLMPPTLVTGFFGMNTENLPFAHTEGGTFFAGVLITLSIGAAGCCSRRRGFYERSDPVDLTGLGAFDALGVSERGVGHRNRLVAAEERP